MATYGTLSSLGGPRDHLDRLVADILDDADDCPLGENPYREAELLKSDASQKDICNPEGKVAEIVPNSFIKNGRCSSGSSSNGDSRDSGYECGIASGSVSTPSSSRRTTSSSDNFSTPTLSSASEAHSPSSEKNSADNNSFNVNLQTSPAIKQDEDNNRSSTIFMKNEIDDLLDSSMPAKERMENHGRYVNQPKMGSGCDLDKEKMKLSMEGNNIIDPSLAKTNMPGQLQKISTSISDYNPQLLENMNVLEKDSSVDSQVAALQQAVAMMKMGNMFDTESKRNADEKISNSSSNIYQRHSTTDSSKEYARDDQSVSSLSSQEQKQGIFLENMLSMPGILGSAPNQKMNHSTFDPQPKISENLQLGVNQNMETSNFGKQNNEDGMLNSALLENLTALAKLDELSSQSNQSLMDMPNNMLQNSGAANKGDGHFNRNQGQELFQRTFPNNGYPMENFPPNYRYNGQQKMYQQQNPSSNLPSDQQTALLQLAAIAAASEQQNSPFGPSPRSMKSPNSYPFSMQANSGFNTGMVERHRGMAVGGRGSPSFGQYGMDPMTHVQDNMRYFRGDTAGRYNNLYGGTPNNGQIPNTMRTMEQKHYAGNSAFLNSGTFDLQNQASGGYINPGNGMIPASTTADLTNSEGSQMQIRCKFGQLGQGRGQFNAPHGFCLGGRDEEIVVADTHNHRIQVFDKNGNFRYMFGSPGKEEGCLWYPRKVVVMKNTTGNFVVCDRGCERSRMQIFSPQGHFIRRIAIRFIDIVAGLAVQCWGDGHIVAVDSVTPTIFVLAEDGRLIKYHECSEFMNEPSDIAVFGRDYYICDFKGHSVVVVNEEGQFLRRIGSEKVTCFPNGIDISDAGDVLIGDSHGNQFHVAVYDKDAQLVSQFVCPNVKVSRCCGLKITMEGYIVTLAKNNHHVLVLNTLYVS